MIPSEHIHCPHTAMLRNLAFKLQPIKMSADLISQLTAVTTKLEGCASDLQDLIRKKKIRQSITSKS